MAPKEKDRFAFGFGAGSGASAFLAPKEKDRFAFGFGAGSGASAFLAPKEKDRFAFGFGVGSGASAFLAPNEKRDFFTGWGSGSGAFLAPKEKDLFAFGFGGGGAAAFFANLALDLFGLISSSSSGSKFPGKAFKPRATTAEADAAPTNVVPKSASSEPPFLARRAAFTASCFAACSAFNCARASAAAFFAAARSSFCLATRSDASRMDSSVGVYTIRIFVGSFFACGMTTRAFLSVFGLSVPIALAASRSFNACSVSTSPESVTTAVPSSDIEFK